MTEAPMNRPGEIAGWPKLVVTYTTEPAKAAALLPPGLEPLDPVVTVAFYCVPVLGEPELGVSVKVEAAWQGVAGQYTVGLGIDQESAVHISARDQRPAQVPVRPRLLPVRRARSRRARATRATRSSSSRARATGEAPPRDGEFVEHEWWVKYSRAIGGADGAYDFPPHVVDVATTFEQQPRRGRRRRARAARQPVGPDRPPPPDVRTGSGAAGDAPAEGPPHHQRRPARPRRRSGRTSTSSAAAAGPASAAGRCPRTEGADGRHHRSLRRRSPPTATAAPACSATGRSSRRSCTTSSTAGPTSFENPYADNIGDDADRNWSSERRLSEMEADGVVAEVIFPNTVPPFFPKGSLVEQPPGASDGDLAKRWAGLQAHNRWLADFCSQAPGRRAGIAQIMLHDVDASVREIEWAKANGLTGGVLLPGAPPGSGVPPLYAPDYEPIWSACEDLGMPVNHHSGSAVPDMGPYPQAQMMFLLEVTWWAHRALWHLIFSGVMERHPTLQFVFTEQGTAWIPEELTRLDYYRGRLSGTGGADGSQEAKFGAGAIERLSLSPTRVLAAAVPPGLELHPPPRGGDARPGRRRPDHVGQRLPPPRGLLAVLAHAPAHVVRRRPRGRGATDGRRATPPTSTASTGRCSSGSPTSTARRRPRSTIRCPPRTSPTSRCAARRSRRRGSGDDDATRLSRSTRSRRASSTGPTTSTGACEPSTRCTTPSSCTAGSSPATPTSTRCCATRRSRARSTTPTPRRSPSTRSSGATRAPAGARSCCSTIPTTAACASSWPSRSGRRRSRSSNS